MNIVKKLIVIVAFIAASVLSACAQNNTEFKIFLELFPKREYPLNLSYEDDSAWEINTPNIPDTLYEKFVFQQEYFIIREREKICFSGFLAFGIFSTKKEYIKLLIGKDSEVSGCGEETWLVTYTPQGEIIDVLFVFGRSTNYDSSEEIIPFRVESEITAESITVKRRETIDSLVRVDERTTKSTFNVFLKIYRISEEGKFILESEEVKYEENYRRR